MKEYIEKDGKYFIDGREVVFKEEPAGLLVPDSVKFIQTNVGVGLVFSDKKKVLLWNKSENDWEAWCMRGTLYNNLKCKLKPCKREDLKAGDWCVSTDAKLEKAPEDILDYSLIVSDSCGLYIRNDRGTYVIDVHYNNYKLGYKVEKV